MKLKLFKKWIDLKNLKVFNWREWKGRIAKLCGTLGKKLAKVNVPKYILIQKSAIGYYELL